MGWFVVLCIVVVCGVDGVEMIYEGENVYINMGMVVLILDVLGLCDV